MSIYIGNSNNIAANISNCYVGINNVARAVKAIYCGDDNGIARLVWSSNPLKKMMVVEYGVSTNASMREAFSIYDRPTNTTLSKTTTTGDVVHYGYTSPIAYSRNDASIVACMTDVNKVITIYKKTSSGYTSIATINQTTLKSYTPNSGNTAFIHTTETYQFMLQKDAFGVSADGKYMYCVASGKFLNSSQVSYGYSAAILIFSVHDNSISFINALNFISYSASSAGTIGEMSASASDDLTVFALNYSYIDPSYSSSYSYGTKCFIGDNTSSYSSNYNLPSYNSGGSWNLISKISVSPDGNHIIYECQQSGSSDRIMQPVKVDKTNKTLTKLTALHTYNYLIYDYGFLGNDYYYMIIPTSSTSNSGQLLFRIYKLSNGNFTLTTGFNLVDPSTNTEFKAYDSSGVMPLEAIGIDVETNVIVISTNNKYYIGSLNGTNGAYTGYTKLTSGEYFSGQAKPTRIWLQ